MIIDSHNGFLIPDVRSFQLKTSLTSCHFDCSRASSSSFFRAHFQVQLYFGAPPGANSGEHSEKQTSLDSRRCEDKENVATMAATLLWTNQKNGFLAVNKAILDLLRLRHSEVDAQVTKVQLPEELESYDT